VSWLRKDEGSSARTDQPESFSGTHSCIFAKSDPRTTPMMEGFFQGPTRAVHLKKVHAAVCVTKARCVDGDHPQRFRLIRPRAPPILFYESPEQMAHWCGECRLQVQGGAQVANPYLQCRAVGQAVRIRMWISPEFKRMVDPYGLLKPRRFGPKRACAQFKVPAAHRCV